MKNINESWIKDDPNKYKIESLLRLRTDIGEFAEVYKDVFNGPPFYEDWDINSAMNVIRDYYEQRALMLKAKVGDKTVGFLVSLDQVPENQREYVQYLNDITFIEEIGVLKEYRNKGIASEMVRTLLNKYIMSPYGYLGYRTNAMRYFDKKDSESFESAAERVQQEDKIIRLNGGKIIIPEFNDDEKQKFINKYIELIQNRPDLDVSNSNCLFRDIFGDLDFSKKGDDYSFQKDPTGEGNDRIFPVLSLQKKLGYRRGR